MSESTKEMKVTAPEPGSLFVSSETMTGTAATAMPDKADMMIDRRSNIFSPTVLGAASIILLSAVS